MTLSPWVFLSWSGSCCPWQAPQWCSPRLSQPGHAKRQNMYKIPPPLLFSVQNLLSTSYPSWAFLSSSQEQARQYCSPHWAPPEKASCPVTSGHLASHPACNLQVTSHYLKKCLICVYCVPNACLMSVYCMSNTFLTFTQHFTNMSLACPWYVPNWYPWHSWGNIIVTI